MKNKLVIILLIASLAVNLLLGVLLYQAKENDQNRVGSLCGSYTLSCIHASSRLNEAMETNSRQKALMAGHELMQLSDRLLVYQDMDVHYVYGPGSLCSLAELIIWGNDEMGIASIGRPDDDTPFSAQEIEIMEKMSAALKSSALTFYPKDTTIDTYSTTERLYSSINAVNRALADLQDAAKSIFPAK